MEFNTDAVLRGLADRVKEYEQDGVGALDDLADDIVKVARDEAPVETGALRSSIAKQGAGRDKAGPFVDYGTDDEAAVYQEFGTRYVSPKAFMRRAMDAAAAHFGKGIR